MGKKFKISALIGIILLCFILVCRFNRNVADCYSLYIYPVISATLSRIASIVPFSLMEIAVIILIIVIISIVVLAITRHWGWKKACLYEANLILWVYVWIYMAWGINYYRSDIFTRAQAMPVSYDAETFTEFLSDYTENINDSYCVIDSIDKGKIEKYVKGYYKDVDDKFGLCSPKKFQHPKKQMFSFLQSAVGVTGYIGPFLDETHVNQQILSNEYIFTYAHEYSHLLGISNEAEANYWAYKVCTSSSDKEIRYNGYFGIIGYVWRNAKALLSEEEFAQWTESLRPEIIQDLFSTQEYWQSKRIKLLDSIQTYLYDIYLKSNKISSGMMNYSEVLLIILSLENQNNK